MHYPLVQLVLSRRPATNVRFPVPRLGESGTVSAPRALARSTWSLGAQRYDRVELPPPAWKTIDFEGRVVKDGVRKAIRDRQLALAELVHAIREYRKIADSKLTLQGSDYAHSVHELNKAIDRAEGLLVL
jgi:hypothetical protein